MPENKSLFYVLAAILILVLSSVAYYYPIWNEEKLRTKITEQWERGQFEQAKGNIIRYYEAHPEDSQIAGYYFELLIQEDPSKAVEALSELSQASTLSPPLRRLQLRALIATKTFDQAITLALALNDAEPDHEENLSLAGQIAYQVGDYNTAISLLDRAYYLNRTSPEIQFHQALAHEFNPDHAARIKAKAALMQFTDDGSAFREDALLALTKSTHLPLFNTDFKEIIEDLSTLPDYIELIYARPFDEAKRIAARFAFFKPEAAYKLYEALLKHPEAQENEIINFIKVAQNLKNPEAAIPFISKLVTIAPENLTYLNLKARNQFLLHDIQQLLSTIGTLLSLDPTNQNALNTLILVASDKRRLHNNKAMKIAELILNHPATTTSQTFIAYNLMLKNNSGEKETLLAKAIDTYKTTDLATLTFWLNERKDFEQVLALITPEKGLSSTVLFFNRSEALLNLEKFAEFRTSLEHEQCPLTALQKEFLQCRLHKAEGKTESARALWENCFELAKDANDYGIILSLARFVDLFTEPDHPLMAYRIAHRANSPFNVFDWQQYFNLLLQAKRYAEALNVIKKALDTYPDLAAFHNNFIYLSLLLNKAVKDPIPTMQQLIEENPQQQEMKVTLALAYHLEGQPQKAITLIEDAELDLTQEGTSAQAIYITILAANGKTALANSYVKSLDKEKLLDPELILIEGLLKPSETTNSLGF